MKKLNRSDIPMRSFVLSIVLLCASLLAEESAVVHILRYDGVINPVAADVIHSAIDQTVREGGECLVIELDTPGGLMKSMQQIVKDILSAPVPVVVYISPSGSRAGSAGVFITYAAHAAIMTPGTNIGAAHPVSLEAASDTSGTMMEKVTNDAVAFIQSIAEKRSRNADWAEKAVRESASVTASEALALGVIDAVVPDVDSLLSWLDGREYEVLQGKKILKTAEARKIAIELSWRLRLLNIIIDPNIAYILLLIGIYGIFFELYNPGSILPGVVGGISLILAFYALHMLPVNYAGLLLILFAIILFIAEIKIPSYGMLTVGGVVSLILGSLMLFKGSLPFLQISWKVIAFATVITTLFFLFAIGLGLRAQRRKPVTGQEGLVGEVGEAVGDFLKGKGQVSVHGEIWEAFSDQKIKKGDAIKVVSIENLKIIVRKNPF